MTPLLSLASTASRRHFLEDLCIISIHQAFFFSLFLFVCSLKEVMIPSRSITLAGEVLAAALLVVIIIIIIFFIIIIFIITVAWPLSMHPLLFFILLTPVANNTLRSNNLPFFFLTI